MLMDIGKGSILEASGLVAATKSPLCDYVRWRSMRGRAERRPSFLSFQAGRLLDSDKGVGIYVYG